MKIGILDSGIGGLTVLKECLKLIPNHEYLYFADSKNAPYGTKSKNQVLELIQKLDAQEMVDLCPLAQLVEFAEIGEFSDEKVLPYLKKSFNAFNLNLYGSIVLGCTHFPLFKSAFEKTFPKGISIIDGSSGTVKRIQEFLTTENESPSIQLFLSGQPLEQGSNSIDPRN